MIYSDKAHLCSVKLHEEKCKGCVHCMRKCPTEAIRVRDGKANVIEPRCVGCGECVRSCPTRAKIAVSDSFDLLGNFKYKVALPLPTCYGQFQHLDNVDYFLQGLLDIGFDDVEEVAVGGEIVGEATRNFILHKTFSGPVISSACPAVVKLIEISYGHLVDRISPVYTPEEVSAEIALERALAKGYSREEIGIFVISPCSAKWEAFRGTSSIDGVLSFSDLYFKLVSAMNKVKEPTIHTRSGKFGLAWATSGGEADVVKGENYLSYLAADGVENCIQVIEEIDHDKLTDLDFVELNACPAGCVGGVFNIENPFLATTRIRELKHRAKDTAPSGIDISKYINTEVYEGNNVFRLSTDRQEAMQLMQRIENIHAALPGIDCGTCGAPSCRAMAEDIVLHGNHVASCPFMNHKQVVGEKKP